MADAIGQAAALHQQRKLAAAATAYEAILARDYPIILTVNFVSGVLVLAGTFISDLLYMFVDPRIRL